MSVSFWEYIRNKCMDSNNIAKQAGAGLGQAQLKLGLDFDLIDLN